jgi:transcriptional regulator with XRE-family HTH domain
VDAAAWSAFGAWVEERRTRRGMSVAALAREAEVSPQWLQEIRKGGRNAGGDGWRLPNPKTESLVRLALALGVPVDEMLTRVGRSGDEPQADLPRHDTASASARIKELEDRVAHHERELSTLRELLGKARRKSG